MSIKSLKDSFIKFCEINKFEKNVNQLKIVDLLISFINSKSNFFHLFFKSNEKQCFYLFGGVGVGKTMIFNHFYEFLKIPKQRLHFNEFMINFHDFRHKNKENSIISFVKKLKKKSELIYLDEFQVTNIVDAMILGKLFESILSENIKILITSNIKINDLYKDGLQRNQFLPFISIMKKKSIEQELTIDGDYRKMVTNKLQRAFFPINEKTSFKGLADIVNNKNGILVPEKCPKSIADAVVKLVTKKKLASNYTKKGFDFVTKMHIDARRNIQLAISMGELVNDNPLISNMEIVRAYEPPLVAYKSYLSLILIEFNEKR